MSLLKGIYYNICSIFPTQVLQQFSGATTLFPYHHLVSDEDVKHIKHLYEYKNVKQFTADLEYLLRYYKPVSVSDVIQSISANKKLPGNTFLLTFDDGLREVSEVIAPILQKKGIPAVFFINPGFLDNKELFYRFKISLVIEAITKRENDHHLLKECNIILKKKFQSTQQLIAHLRSIMDENKMVLDELAGKLGFTFEEYLKINRPYLTSAQVSELGNDGFTIGSHSWDHPYYKFLSRDEQKMQTIRSADFVKRSFHPSHNLFSFPHMDTEVTQDFFDEMAIEYPDIDAFFGVQNQKSELKNKMLHRFNAERPHLSMKKQLNGIIMLIFLQRLFKKQQVKRKYA